MPGRRGPRTRCGATGRPGGSGPPGAPSPALPADPAAISVYLTFLAGHGARVGTMSRRLSAIRFAHRLRDLPDPTEAARVVAVWEGIRRIHGAPPEQAAPLMPPELFAVLDACPQTRHWKTKGRAAQPDLAGLRDRALILVGFVAALRRSELVGLDVDAVAAHPNGLVVTIRRSKTNQTGEAEHVVLPAAATRVAARSTRCIPGPPPPASPAARCCARSARATARWPADSTPTRRTCSSSRRSPVPELTRSPTPRTACAPDSSPTPTCAAPATGPSPTKPATAPWPPSAATCASPRPGWTTPPPSWASDPGGTSTGSDILLGSLVSSQLLQHPQRREVRSSRERCYDGVLY